MTMVHIETYQNLKKVIAGFSQTIFLAQAQTREQQLRMTLLGLTIHGNGFHFSGAFVLQEIWSFLGVVYLYQEFYW